MTLDGTTFQQNSASDAGGGRYEDGSFAHLNGGQVMFNHASSGGGIFNADTVTLTNTVVRFKTVHNCEPALTLAGCTG